MSIFGVPVTAYCIHSLSYGLIRKVNIFATLCDSIEDSNSEVSRVCLKRAILSHKNMLNLF